MIQGLHKYGTGIYVVYTAFKDRHKENTRTFANGINFQCDTNLI
jgi:hypothetical protein